MSGFELLLCTSLLDCRPAPQPIELLKSSNRLGELGVNISLFYCTGLSKFEGYSIKLFDRVTAK